MRKTPHRHPVSGHYRNGKWINSFERGSGQKSQRSSKVVGSILGCEHREDQVRIIFPTMVDPEGNYPIDMINHNFRDSPTNRFIKKYGKEFGRAKSGTNRLLTRRELFCFENSRLLYLEMKEEGRPVHYYEGWASVESGITSAHAWIVEKGKVIDDTWGDEGFKYIGVPIKHKYLKQPLKRFVIADYPVSKVADK